MSNQVLAFAGGGAAFAAVAWALRKQARCLQCQTPITATNVAPIEGKCSTCYQPML